jgi:hypothetical protein
MAHIPNIGVVNTERQKAIKLQTSIDESIVFTHAELRETLRGILDDELNISAQNLAFEKKFELESRLNFKLKQLENSLVNLINERIDKITERIVTLTINRVIEEEVTKRLDDRLKQIKDKL